jgi:hypothetical protein
MRASIVLAWCAAVSRIHQVIGSRGIEAFNKATKSMCDIKEGRYKRYSSPYALQSPSELRTVFDTHLLWVLEYLELLDSNQHDRLALCFTIRNNCAHPSDAPITEANLVSFFSDIEHIVFRNPKMRAAKAVHAVQVTAS